MNRLSNRLSLHNIHKSYGETQALNGVSFEIEQGEIVALLGPSGCGKSTLLAIIAGLEPADQGQIRWNGQSLQAVPPHQRGFGLMFQDYMLFPHKNVAENIAFGLRMQKLDPASIASRVDQMLEQIGLAGYGKRDINTLSGGEQQRVALARSLAPRPHLLMLDEPLGALDRALREYLLVELRDLLQAMQQTAIYVTHDQEEAFALADRVIVMHQGQIAQIGVPQVIYKYPNSHFVAGFLGFTNLLAGNVIQSGGQSRLQTALGEYPFPTQATGPVNVLLRPDQVYLDQRGQFNLTGNVLARAFRGSLFRIELEVKGQRLRFEFPSTVELPQVGETIQLGFDPIQAFQILQ